MSSKNIYKIIPIILAGGTGSRLWPLSRKSFPKQFLNLLDDDKFTMLQKTYKRLKISKKNYFRQYLAYHEGWKNYKHYNKKSNVVGYAKQVSIQAKKYRSQLNRCKKKLNKKKYIIF